MISLYVNFAKIGEISMHTPTESFIKHPLIGTHGVTFTVWGGIVHSDFNMVELFLELRQYGLWTELNREFDNNPLKVYTKLTRGLPNPWLHVPYSLQAWFNGNLVLGYAENSEEAALYGDEEIIVECKQSPKFDPTSVNTLTIYQGKPDRFSVVTYDVTEDCATTYGRLTYIKRNDV